MPHLAEKEAPQVVEREPQPVAHLLLMIWREWPLSPPVTPLMIPSQPEP